jgi:drug/metabolite transporter (DMT)-like permease
MTRRKYLLLLGVACFGALGDVALSRGMKDIGTISIHDLSALFGAIFTPWVGIGIVLLLAFMAAYMTALSWADLTYVLPASALGYIVLALLAKFFLHENITPTRWAGIVLISLGVGFVTRGPEKTSVFDKPADCAPHTPEPGPGGLI